MTQEIYYKCGQCNWQGPENQLDFDTTETCFGDEKIEVCPKCASLEVRVYMKGCEGDNKT